MDLRLCRPKEVWPEPGSGGPHRSGRCVQERRSTWARVPIAGCSRETRWRRTCARAPSPYLSSILCVRSDFDSVQDRLLGRPDRRPPPRTRCVSRLFRPFSRSSSLPDSLADFSSAAMRNRNRISDADTSSRLNRFDRHGTPSGIGTSDNEQCRRLGLRFSSRLQERVEVLIKARCIHLSELVAGANHRLIDRDDAGDVAWRSADHDVGS